MVIGRSSSFLSSRLPNLHLGGEESKDKIVDLKSKDEVRKMMSALQSGGSDVPYKGDLIPLLLS